MLIYKKENGFPVSISLATLEAEDSKEGWKGFETIVTSEDNQEIARFFHNHYRSRVHWVNGFFKGLTYKEDLPEFENYSGAQL